MVWIAVAAVLGLAAIEIAKIKYSVAREGVAALSRLTEIEEQLKGVDWEKVKDLQIEVQTLHNMNALSGRK